MERTVDGLAPAHRITWFGVERPVEGTVFVRPPVAEPEGDFPEDVDGDRR